MSESEWFEEKMRAEFGDPDPVLPHRRMIVLPWLIWALIVVSVIAATNAWSQEVKPVQESALIATVGDNTLTLYRTDCLLGGWFATWKRAVWFYEGKNIEACWTPQQDQFGTVFAHTVDEAGEAGAIPFRMFRRREGV